MLSCLDPLGDTLRCPEKGRARADLLSRCQPPLLNLSPDPLQRARCSDADRGTAQDPARSTERADEPAEACTGDLESSLEELAREIA